MLAMSGFLATSGRYQTEVKHSEKTRNIRLTLRLKYMSEKTRANTNPFPKVFDSLVNFCLNNIIVDRVTDPKDGRHKNTHTHLLVPPATKHPDQVLQNVRTDMDNSDYLTLQLYF